MEALSNVNSHTIKRPADWLSFTSGEVKIIDFDRVLFYYLLTEASVNIVIGVVAVGFFSAASIFHRCSKI